jgi:hypothetical protein
MDDSRRAVSLELVARLEAIAARMESYTCRYDLMHDARAIFCETYSLMTRIIARELPKRAWSDPSWIVALAEAFSRRYFAVLDAYDQGVLQPGAWLTAFGSIRKKRTSVLEAVVCGMACHIMHDLPLGLTDVGFADGPPNARIGDYHLMNDVLVGAIDEIYGTIARRYNPALFWLEILGKRSEDLLTSYGIRLGRSDAWYNACRLDSPVQAEALASIERAPETFIGQLVKPPAWSLRVLLRAFRWITALGRRWPNHSLVAEVLPAQSLANRDYYFHVGVGDWSGTFTFRVTNLAAFWHERLSLKNRLLGLGLIIIFGVLKSARIDSTMRGFPDQGESGSAYNLVRISRFGITLFLLRETYTMHPDGEGVFVQSLEEFGPSPVSIGAQMRYPARVEAGGMHTLYFMPLLSAQWTGDYHVAPSLRHLDSVLECAWAEAEEHIDKVSPPDPEDGALQAVTPPLCP